MRWTGRSPPPIRPSTRPSPPIRSASDSDSDVAPEMTEELAEELEALDAIFGDEMTVVEPGRAFAFALPELAAKLGTQIAPIRNSRSSSREVPRRTRPRSRASRIDGRVAEPRARVDHRRRERRGNGGEAFARIAGGVFGRDRGAEWLDAAADGARRRTKATKSVVRETMRVRVRARGTTTIQTLSTTSPTSPKPPPRVGGNARRRTRRR